jgi:hypothetical protein
MKQILTW